MAELLAADITLRRSMRRQRVFIDRLNPLEILHSEEDVKERYRFFRPTIYAILRDILDDIQRPTYRSESLPPLLVLCSALRYYAIGSYYTVLGDCKRISKASVCRSVKVVTEALCKRAGQVIKWPSEEGLEVLKERFYEIAGY